MQKNEQKNDALYKKYTNFTRKDLMFSNFVQTNIAGAIALFFIGNVSWMFLQSTPDTMLCRAKNKIYMPYKKAIHDAYIPVEKYIVDDNTYKTGELKVSFQKAKFTYYNYYNSSKNKFQYKNGYKTFNFGYFLKINEISTSLI